MTEQTQTPGLLATRESTHGDYTDTSLFAQTIKNMCRGSANWKQLSLPQQESLDLIATKIARILSGNPHEVDHWKDIAGYATLAEKSLAVPAPKPFSQSVPTQKYRALQMMESEYLTPSVYTEVEGEKFRTWNPVRGAVAIRELERARADGCVIRNVNGVQIHSLIFEVEPDGGLQHIRWDVINGWNPIITGGIYND